MLEAEREGLPFLLLRDDKHAQVIVGLADRDRLTMGRKGCDVALKGDPSTSRVHAELHRVGTDWTVWDDGLSRNGTFVNGTRLTGRRRLADGDTLRLGATTIVFRAPPPIDDDDADDDTDADENETIPAPGQPVDPARLTPMQRRVLRALCAPYATDRTNAVPATNQEIADVLVISVDGVKTHLHLLFKAFGLGDVVRGNKRTRLAQLAIQHGIVDLRKP